MKPDNFTTSIINGQALCGVWNMCGAYLKHVEDLLMYS